MIEWVNKEETELYLTIAKDRFYWYGMTRDIEYHIQHCGRCIRRKTPNTKAPLVSITTY